MVYFHFKLVFNMKSYCTQKFIKYFTLWVMAVQKIELRQILVVYVKSLVNLETLIESITLNFTLSVTVSIKQENVYVLMQLFCWKHAIFYLQLFFYGVYSFVTGQLKKHFIFQFPTSTMPLLLFFCQQICHYCVIHTYTNH